MNIRVKHKDSPPFAAIIAQIQKNEHPIAETPLRGRHCEMTYTV
nr:MAG TPA: hypothetical protein [Caudoviricetes sp.]